MKKRAIIWILSVLLSACSVIGDLIAPSRPQITQPIIQAWIDNQEFGKALDALDATKQTDPRFAALRVQLESERSAYERNSIHRADKLIGQGHWAEALAEIDRALAKIPNSAALNQHLRKMRKRQRFEIDVVKNDLLMFNGEYMARRVLPAYETIVMIMPHDKMAKSKLTIAKNKADKLAVRISELGLKAVSNGDEKHGAYLLKLATLLTLDPVAINAYKDFLSMQTKRKLQKKNKPRRPQARQRRNAKAHELEDAIEKFDAFFKAKRYNEAKITLDRIRKNPEYHGTLIATREKNLQKAVAARIDLLYQEGATYYRKEIYEFALKRWLAVLQLQPEHEKAKKYSERTKRILAKLNQLRKKQHVHE